MPQVSLKIGQLIFYFVRDKGRLEPLRVVEELSRKTMTGVETVYMVASPDQPDPVPLTTLKGDMFTSIEEARRIMTERSLAAVKTLIDSAIHSAQEKFPGAPISLPPEVEQVAQEIPQEDEVMEVDGQLVKVRSVSLPDALK